MAVNNEVGTISPLADVVALVREQAPGACSTPTRCRASSGSTCRPRRRRLRPGGRIGAQVRRTEGCRRARRTRAASVEPLLMGGGQERDRRSGTHNVAGIVAMAEAMKATAASAHHGDAGGALRDRLLDGLLAEVHGLVETVPRDRKAAGSAHVCIEGVENEALLFLLDRGGRVCVRCLGVQQRRHGAVPRPGGDGSWPHAAGRRLAGAPPLRSSRKSSASFSSPRCRREPNRPPSDRGERSRAGRRSRPADRRAADHAAPPPRHRGLTGGRRGVHRRGHGHDPGHVVVPLRRRAPGRHP